MSKKSYLIVIAAMILYFAVFSYISVWKYQTFQYNAMDLAIINQVFYNSAQGDWFASSIHPENYLGDHVPIILFLLLPIYFLFQSPVTLLILQTAILALTAWPLYLISKKVLNKNWAIFVSLAWLLNPFVHNINLFEFHFLPFALIFILFAFYFFQVKKFIPFILCALLAMLVREDVALVIFFFSVLAFIEKRNIKWIVAPLIGSVIYFLAAMKINSLFAPAENYKFLIYYSWFGQTPLEVLKNFVTQPHVFIAHLLRFQNLEFLLGIFLPFMFIPIIAPLYLILALGIFAQFILGASGTSSLLLSTHYSALILPAVFIAWIFGFKKIISNQAGKISAVAIEFKNLASIILATTIIYSALALGPLLGSLQGLAQNSQILAKTNQKNTALNLIPQDASVAATYEFLTNLSTRSNIYSFNYAFLGKQQFLTSNYTLPSDVEYLAIDFDDLLTYDLQYGKNNFYQYQYNDRLNSWHKLLDNFGLIYINDTIAVFKKNSENKMDLIQNLVNQKISKVNDVSIENNLNFLGHNNFDNKFELFWQTNNLKKNYYLKVSLHQDKQIKFEKIYPLGYGLLIDKTNKKIQTNYWFDFSPLPSGTYELQIDVVKIIDGINIVNSVRGTSAKITEQEIVAEKIVAEKITL